jgi:hypothetical protein
MEKWATDLFVPIINKDVVVPSLGDPKPYTSENL